MADYKRQFDSLQQFADAVAEVLADKNQTVHEKSVYMRADTQFDEYKTSAVIGVMYSAIYRCGDDRTLMECERVYGTVHDGDDQAQKDAAADIDALNEFCNGNELKSMEGRIELF